MAWETSALVLAWVAIILLSFAVAGLVRNVRTLVLRQMPPALRIGPAVGQPVPDDIRGRLAQHAEVEGRRHSFVLFVDPSCEPCRTALARVRAELSPRDYLVISNGNDGIAVDRDASLIEGRKDLFDDLGISATPFAVVVDGSGLVVDAAAIGSHERADAFVARFTALDGQAERSPAEMQGGKR